MQALLKLAQARALPYLLTVGAGIAGAFAFTPWNGFWLALTAWAILFWILASTYATTPKQGAIFGALFGISFFGTGVSWIFISLHTYGGMDAWLAALATFLFCAVLTCFPTLFAYLFVRVKNNRLGPLPLALLFGTLWALTEWLRGWIFTGFPWLSLGYSQLPPSPLAGYLPLLGVFGVSLLTALSAALLLCKRQGWAFLGVIWLSGWGLQQVDWTVPSGEPLAVALLQGNIGQNLKWDPARYILTLQTYDRLVTKALAHHSQPKLIVLPETAFPSFFQDIPADYLEHLNAQAKLHDATLLLGSVTGTDKGYHNSAVTIGEAEGQLYHKTHLVPFGEAVPTGFRWFLSLAKIPMSDFTPGELAQAVIRIRGINAAINICYEDIFGEEIIRSLPTANLLINLSNTAWFGDSLAQPQHLQIARTRAIETGRPMLRATNTGMTALIQPNGHVENVLPAFTEGVLFGEVQPYSGATPYSRWGNTAFLMIAASFLINILRRRTHHQAA